MNYEQTVTYLFDQLAMYQREGASALKPKLDNITQLCAALGSPEGKFKSVHVAGTNGKGSVSHMLASVLQSAGYKVGLYTSPHLKDFRERIKINGEMIPESSVVNFVASHQELFTSLEPSFFEMTVSMAFDYFASEEVDIAIVETGLGGRLDATNIIDPILSVITNISLDHTAFLGTSLASIAFEKAGIIKRNTPVLIGESIEETKPIFINKANESNANIYFADEIYEIGSLERGTDYLKLDVIDGENGSFVYQNLKSELAGLYQQKNILAVVASIKELRKLNFKIDDDVINEGFSKVVSQTGILGRWQILSDSPLMIADVGHNKEGVKEVLSQIKKTPHTNLHFVFGVVSDKDLSSMLDILPKNATYYFCKAAIPRALDEDELRIEANKVELLGESYQSVEDAVNAAKESATRTDLIFIGGSAFVVAEAI